jgi:hypothetical protein
MWGGTDAADTSPTSLIVILWIYAAHYCPSNRTEHKGGSALNTAYLLMRDCPSLMTSSNCRLVWSLLSDWRNFGRIPLVAWELGEDLLCGRSPTYTVKLV